MSLNRWRIVLLAFVAVLMMGQPKVGTAGDRIAIAQYGQWLSGFPWIVAKGEGFLREEGLEIESFVSSHGGGTSVRNILASPVPFGEVATSAAVSAIREGLPLVILYAAVNHPGEIRWMALPGSSINSVKDLVGKTVGYTQPKSSSEMMLRLTLDAAGIPADQVKMVATGGLGGGLSMLAAGGIDAAPIVDPVLTKSGDQYRLVFWPAETLPAMTAGLGVVNPAYARENPEKVEKLVRARRKAVDWIYANPVAAADYCAKFLDIDKELAAKLLPKFIEWKFWSPGSFSKDGLDVVVKGLNLLGTVQGEVDWASYIDERYLPNDLRSKP